MNESDPSPAIAPLAGDTPAAAGDAARVARAASAVHSANATAEADAASAATRLAAVRLRLRNACERANRPTSAVTLLAVSKTWPAERVRELAELGQHEFAENYLQEGLDKIDACDTLGLTWHFIGPIQSNKTRPIAEHFDWVHTIERDKIARRLSEQRPADLPALQICIQVNVSGEASKSGCAPDQALALALDVARLPRLRLRGLMTIPEASSDPRLLRDRFASLNRLATTIRVALAATDASGALARDFNMLSMGMSDDLEDAIAEGATLVRIGTALFGKRVQQPEPERPPDRKHAAETAAGQPEG